MTKKASEAYACVAYRIMEYERNGQSEEYLCLIMEMLHEFFNEQEIIKVYQQNVYIDSFQALFYDKNKKYE